jgi:hypothetical protein
MAKPRYLSKATQSNRGKNLGILRRVDVTTLPKKEQKKLIAFALRIQDLVYADDAGVLFDDVLSAAVEELRKKPWELRTAMHQFRRYHAAYAEEHPANAFTPVLRKPARRTATESDDRSSDTVEAPAKRPPTRGTPIALVPEPEQTRIRAFAERINELNKLKQALGRVPHGERERAAAEFGCTPDWISKNMRLQKAYVAAYPDEPFYNAHTPRQIGRPKGRTVPDEVRETIEQARVNKRWLSRNGAGGYDEIDHVIEKKLIHSLIVERFGAIHSESTTYRVISDYEERRAARVAVADNDIGGIQNHLPTISNKARGPGERAQFDARPFPVVVDNDGVPCTVHGMFVFDDATGYIASWELLPAKRLDGDGEIYRQTFKDQVSRATVARGVMQVGRFRSFYADHGYEPLEKYMVFMVAPGEDPTQLLHSRVARPRGRGKVERGLQLVDGFLKTRPSYVRERDFRRSRTKKRARLSTFAQFYEDFAAYVHHWNHDPAPGGGPSRADLLKQGPSYFLTPPAPENLAMFAMSNRTEQRAFRRDGDVCFWLDAQGYEPYRRDAALYKQFSDLSSRGDKIEINVFDFGMQAQDRIVLFSLDGQKTWELAVPAGRSALSSRRHTELLIEVEQQLAREDAASLDAFFQKIILGSTKGPLVLNGLARERTFYYHQSVANELPSEEQLAQLDEILHLPKSPEHEPIVEGEAQTHNADGTAGTQGEAQTHDTVGSIDAKGAPIQSPSPARTGSRAAKEGRSRQSKRTATSAQQPGIGQPTDPTTNSSQDAAPVSSRPSSIVKAPNILEQLLKRRQQRDE